MDEAPTTYAFVFADLAGYTALTEAHGDVDAARVALDFADLARRALAPGTHLVKTIGDAVMIAAPDPLAAACTAISLARECLERTQFLAVRIGIHVGSAVRREGDYYGAAVNVAARLAAHARAGEILCSDGVAACVADLSHVECIERGEVQLKNVLTPCRVWELQLTHVSEGRDCFVDPICRMRVTADDAAMCFEHLGTIYYFCSESCGLEFKRLQSGR